MTTLLLAWTNLHSNSGSKSEPKNEFIVEVTQGNDQKKARRRGRRRRKNNERIIIVLIVIVGVRRR